MGDTRNTARLGMGWFGGRRKAPRSGSARRRHEMRPMPDSLEGRTLLSVGLDPTWGWGGGAAPLLPPDTATTSYRASLDSIAMQKGQVVALGTLTTDVSGSGGTSTSTTNLIVTRLTTSGTVDGTFGTGGTTMIPLTGGGVTYTTQSYSTGDIAVQPNGNIDVLATVTPTGGNVSQEMMVVQLTSTGAIDPSFGTSGFQFISFGTSTTPQAVGATALAIGPNGKIDTLGGTTMPTGDQVFAVAQLTSNGMLDTSFDGTGMTTVNFQLAGTTPGNEMDSPSGIVVQPNGSVVVVGSASMPPSTTGPTLTQAAVARLTAAGTLDPSFNGTGKLTYTYNLGGSSDDFASSVALDGSLIAIGGTTSQQSTSTTGSSAPLPAYTTVTMLTTNGTFDTGFNGSGKFILTYIENGVPFDTSGSASIVPMKDGSLLVGSYFNQQSSNSGPNGALLAHVTSSGALDPLYGNNGVALIEPVGLQGRVLLQADGKVIFSEGSDILRTTAPPPNVVASNLMMVGKGKKARVMGVTIQFNTAVNMMLADNPNAYMVLPMKGNRAIRIRKKGGVVYDPTTNTLTLRFLGRVQAGKGLRVIIKPSGIVGADGAVLFNGQPMPIIITPTLKTA